MSNLLSIRKSKNSKLYANIPGEDGVVNGPLKDAAVSKPQYGFNTFDEGRYQDYVVNTKRATDQTGDEQLTQIPR